MVVFDTDCLIGLVRKDDAAIRTIRVAQERGDRLCITSLSAFELLKGVMRSKRPDEARAKLLSVMSTFFVIDFSYIDADAAARIDAELLARGTPIGTIDTLIASICVTTGETLITRNAKHYARIKGLSVETW